MREREPLVAVRVGRGELVPASVGTVSFDLGKSLWLWAMVGPGVVVAPRVLTPTLTVASLLLTFATLCLGHSVGLHRGIIHRTYKTHALVRGALAYLFVLSGLGGPLSWARLHAVRDYWQNQQQCPRYFAYRHSMLRDAVWNLHLRFEARDDRADARLPVDVMSDPWLRFLEATWPLHLLAFALVTLCVGGADAVAVCVCARIAAGVLGHWAVGYVAHRFGERRFVVIGATESGTNNWLLAALSFGEGFHNNHHAHPASARMAMRAHDVDLGWWMIALLERTRVVHEVRAWHRTDVAHNRAAITRPQTTQPTPALCAAHDAPCGSTRGSWWRAGRDVK